MIDKTMLMLIFSKLKRNRLAKGFTFVEILLVVSLLGILSLGIYNSLSHGLRIWSKSRHINIEEDVLIFFDKLGQDLANSFQFSELKWQGDSNELSFPTIVRVSPDPLSGFEQNDYALQPGETAYLYDFSKRKLFRRQASYGQVKNDKFDQKRVLVSSLKSIKFRYLYMTADGRSFLPEMKQMPPEGIYVEVEFSGEHESQKMNRFFDIPWKG